MRQSFLFATTRQVQIMAEELQHLLERIQKDGVEKADAKAAAIVTAAEARAAAIIKDAEARARRSIEKAEQDTQLMTERGRKALEQAARDVILSVENAVSLSLQGLVASKTREALSTDTLKAIIVKMVENYLQSAQKTGNVEILASRSDEEKLRDYFVAELKKAAAGGLVLRSDNEVVSGLKISMAGGNVQHDFSGEAIAEALGKLVRPYLAEIIRAAGSR